MGYDKSKDLILNEIDTALTYNSKYTRLTKEQREKLNNYARKITDDLREKWNKI